MLFSGPWKKKKSIRDFIEKVNDIKKLTPKNPAYIIMLHINNSFIIARIIACKVQTFQIMIKHVDVFLNIGEEKLNIHYPFAL